MVGFRVAEGRGRTGFRDPVGRDTERLRRVNLRGRFRLTYRGVAYIFSIKRQLTGHSATRVGGVISTDRKILSENRVKCRSKFIDLQQVAFRACVRACFPAPFSL